MSHILFRFISSTYYTYHEWQTEGKDSINHLEKSVVLSDHPKIFYFEGKDSINHLSAGLTLVNRLTLD